MRDTPVCAYCWDPVEMTAPGVGVAIDISHPVDFQTRTMWAHRTCFVRHLNERMQGQELGPLLEEPG